MSRFVNKVYIADGFASDCEELVNRCLQLPQVDFQGFSIIWKDMNFGLLYQGRASGAEIAELSEELVDIAKHYMVKDTSIFEESVTGLFLIYGLLSLQPYTGFACLRLVPADVRAVRRIEMVARRERRVDVLYVLGEVLVKSTQYHAEEQPRGMEPVMRKYLDGGRGIDKLGVRPMGVFYRQNQELDLIRDLSSLTRQYTFAKKSIVGENHKGDPTLQYIDENLTTELHAALRKLTNGVIDVEEVPNRDGCSEDGDEVAEVETRSRTVQDIKFKAMSQAVDPMKHLISADERKRTQTSLRSASDLKKPTGKIKTNKHIKPITISPKKRNVGKKPKKKKAKGDLIEEDEDLNSIDDDDGEERNDDGKRNEEPGTSASKNEELGEGIDIESIPLISRTGNNDIEIEIIDQTKGNNTVTTTKNTSIIGNQIEIEIIDHMKINEKDKNAKITETSDIGSNSLDSEIVIKDEPRNVRIKKNKAQKTKATNTTVVSSNKDGDEIVMLDKTNDVNIKNKRDQKTIKTNEMCSNEDDDELIMIDKSKDVNIKNKIGHKNSKSHNKSKSSSSEDDEPLSVSCRTRTYKRTLKEEPTQDKLFPPKKKDRRDQVRRDVKSRFKRLGMLPVANFEENV